MDKSVDEIALLIDGTVIGDGAARVHGLNGIREAGPGELTFLSSPQYASFLESTRATAVLVPANYDLPKNGRTYVRVADPYLGFAKMLQEVEKETLIHPAGRHATAVVGENVVLGANVGLDAHVRIADDCRIGNNVVLYAGVYVGRGSVIGDDTVIFPNTVVRERISIGKRCIIHSNVSLGSDGFGFAAVDGVRAKIAQVGTIEIGDDVEIGANSGIDRATSGKTVIGNGTKIDNLVQIGHNVVIGQNTTISGATAIAGSTKIGNNVTIGGMVGIRGHIEIGDNAMIAGASQVGFDVPAGAMMSGYPAIEHNVNRKVMVSQKRLPELIKRIRQLEQKIQELEHDKHG